MSIKENIFELAFAQQGLWFICQLDVDSCVYNLPLLFEVKGNLSLPALELAFSQILRRHESLRTRIRVVRGLPVQAIAEPEELVLPVIDLTELSEEDRDTEAERIVAEEARLPFDLSRGPLVRFKLFRLGGKRYLFFLNMHHIIWDGWSVGVFLRELGVLYESFLGGEGLPLAELPIQYADYAEWQREWLQGEVLDKQIEYWKEKLGGELTELQLPVDRPRPAVASYRGARQSFELSGTLTTALKELSRREGVTLFMMLLSAFKTLLYRYTGQEDIIVGSVIANRNRRELEGLIGFFANTLVLRTDLSEGPNFKELLGRVREVTLEAYAHQDLPFDRLVQILGPERDMSRQPLFQVMFVLQDASLPSLELPGVTMNVLEVDNGTSKFDLTLEMREDRQVLSGVIEYSTDLFDRATIDRMIRHFRVLLDGIVLDPTQRLWELPLLTEGERHRLLVEWNGTRRDYPRDKCIHELFEEQVERAPDAVAVVCEDEQLSYRELSRRSNLLAQRLQELGVGPDVLVALYMERSIEMMVAILGILKAGGAYVPLDPRYPQERIAFMLEDTDASIVLSQSRLMEGLPDHRPPVLCMDAGWGATTAENPVRPHCNATAENLAYVLYTSGSTGRPKGVAVPHRGISRLVIGSDYVKLDENQTILQLAPVSFDVSTFEIWGALLKGGTCVVFPGNGLQDLTKLKKVIRKNCVNTLVLTASLFNLIIDEAPETLSGIKQLIAGGEALSVAHICHGISKLPEVQLVNGYGPSESTFLTCCYDIPKDLSESSASVPIGRPISNTQVYILDAHLQPVPVGVPGELYIGGDGLARGYLNRPELTAEKFVSDPFSDDAESRLYGSGDLARYLADGNIEFLGRLDDQVKIRGFRVELGEIERVLKEHPLVRDALVVVRGDEPGAKRLVSYTVVKEGAVVSDFRDYLQGKLPEYMVPSVFAFLDEFPLTPNGKVDREALPVSDKRPVLAQTYVAPRSEVERVIASVLGEVLEIEKVGIYDNIFDLGAHSLSITQVVSRLREAYQIELPLRSLFESPNVASLAEIVDITIYARQTDHLNPIDNNGGHDKFEI